MSGLCRAAPGPRALRPRPGGRCEGRCVGQGDGRCEGRCVRGAVTGGVTGGAARPLSPPRAAAGPLPPSPGAAAGGRMEQGLSAISLYCAPAGAAMEPEQVSGAGGRLSGRCGRRGPAQPPPERGEAAAGPAGPCVGPRPEPRGRAGLGEPPGPCGLGEPPFPAVAAGAAARPRERRSVCLSVCQPACNYSQRGGHACLRCLPLAGGQCL